MSLNGLDNAAITEAFQAARAENGGWLLLKYTTRDEVELLKKGNGGVAELRGAITSYTEESPLYGFLRFRRRSVLVKYIPEGTSRLLQARVTVHFQSILDKFSPHDTVFPITASTDLKETKLSAACSLHAASNSTSSSNSSLPRPHLSEIFEDSEEVKAAKTDAQKPLPPLPSDGPPLASITRKASVRSQAEGRSSVETERAFRNAVQAATSPSKEPEERPVTRASSVSRARASSLSRASGQKLSRPASPAGLARDRSNSAVSKESAKEGERSRRPSTSSIRPAVRELYNGYANSIKTKVKLGPRPSLDTGGRPQTSGSDAKSGSFRPISALPAGLKVAPRKATRPKTKTMSSAPLMTSALSPPPPAADYDYPLPSIASPPSRPTTSPQSIMSSSASMHSTASRPVGMTPEKRRLMKALALRKKQMDLAAQQISTPPKTYDADIEGLGVDRPRPLPDAVEASLTDAASSVGEDPPPPESIQAMKTAVQNEPVENVQKSESLEEGSLHKVASSPASMADSPEEASTKASSVSDQVESSPSLSQETVREDAPSTASEIVTNGDDLDKAANHSPASDDTVIHAPTAAVELESPAAINKSVADAEPPVATPSNKNDDSPALKPDPTTEDIRSIGGTPEAASLPVSVLEPIKATPLRADSLPPKAPERSSEIAAEGKPTSKEVRVQTPEPAAHSGDATPRKLAHDEEDGLILQKPTPDTPRSPPDDINGKSGYWSGTSVSGSGTNSKRTSLEHKEAPNAKKRRGGVAPIRTDLVLDDSDDNLLSDESFMSELGAATVLEAKPVSVRRSPSASQFAIHSNDPRMGSRTASNPSLGANQAQSTGLEVPPESRGRSISGTFLNNGVKQSPIAVIKKINVSSGISQRIKALEKLSSLTSAPSPPIASLSPNTSPSSIAQRQSSVRLPSRGNSLFGSRSRAASSSPSPHDLPAQPGQSYPKGDRSYNPRTESVSVKARIVRDPKQSYTQRLEPAPDSIESLELRESPLVIEHHKAGRSHERLKSAQAERPLSVASANRISRSGSASPAINRRASGTSRNSGSSLKNDTRSSASHKSSSSSVATVIDERKDHKKESTTSRIFRRMSTMSGGSRKAASHPVSPTVKEEDHAVEPIASALKRRSSVDVGEVNVQFPDSLLWKRRVLNVDSQGYINLIPSKSDENSRTSTKRYHLSEFNAPFIPDQDRQELPNSVILDIRDGGTLQCACEHQAGQAHVLHSLRESRRNWIA